MTHAVLRIQQPQFFQQCLGTRPADHRRGQLEKLVRYRPHILSEKEERLLAMQGEVAGSASTIFEQLNDAAPVTKTDKGEVPAYKLSVNDLVIKAMAMALKAVDARRTSAGPLTGASTCV